VKGHSGPAQLINADAAINQFPPELLSKIFLICAALLPTDELINRTRDQNNFECNFECADHLPWIRFADTGDLSRLDAENFGGGSCFPARGH
jgi:hypothetical protein